MYFHLLQALTIVVIAPLVCFLIETIKTGPSKKWLVLVKWVLVWSVGIRSLSAGLMQLINPSYTAQIIFELSGTDYYIFIRELGVANIAIGLTALGSYKITAWRVPAAFISFIFNFFLSMNHILHFQAGVNELVSFGGDLFVVGMLSVFLVQNLMSYRGKGKSFEKQAQ